MPHKDPVAAAASKRAYYLANKDKWARSKAAQRARRQAEAVAKKAAAAAQPKQVVFRVCKDCGTDITQTYRSNSGMRCAACVAAYMRKYREENAERIALLKAQWKAANLQTRRKRVPTWLSDDDAWMIQQAYELAAQRKRVFGFPWHVDHKIPLKGRTVSGLHVPANLQVIPGAENLRKSNRFEVQNG